MYSRGSNVAMIHTGCVTLLRAANHGGGAVLWCSAKSSTQEAMCVALRGELAERAFLTSCCSNVLYLTATGSI